MDANIAFLIQATRMVQTGGNDANDIESIYQFVVTLESDVLIMYYNTCTVISYSSDLELYIELLEYLRKHYEAKEEYEKCAILRRRFLIALDIKKPIKSLSYGTNQQNE